MALPSDYHSKQADVLLRLALTTRDVDMALVLMHLAAEHAVQAHQLTQLMCLAGETNEKRGRIGLYPEPDK